jgi:hypothetical protein
MRPVGTGPFSRPAPTRAEGCFDLPSALLNAPLRDLAVSVGGALTEHWLASAPLSPWCIRDSQPSPCLVNLLVHRSWLKFRRLPLPERASSRAVRNGASASFGH